MRMGECHFQSVEGQIDVTAVFVAAGRRHALHHLDGVFGHGPGGAFLASPVGISKFGDQLAALLERIKRERYIKLPPKSGFYADLDIVVIDEYGDVQFFLHCFFLDRFPTVAVRSNYTGKECLACTGGSP